MSYYCFHFQQQQHRLNLFIPVQITLFCSLTSLFTLLTIFHLNVGFLNVNIFEFLFIVSKLWYFHCFNHLYIVEYWQNLTSRYYLFLETLFYDYDFILPNFTSVFHLLLKFNMSPNTNAPTIFKLFAFNTYRLMTCSPFFKVLTIKTLESTSIFLKLILCFHYQCPVLFHALISTWLEN